MEKIRLLEEWLRREERVVVAFSGGVDSALLALVAGQQLDSDIVAVTSDSESLPSRDREFVREFCKIYGIRHQFIETSEFNSEEFRRNPENRCYYCKKKLFESLVSYAKQNNFRSVLDGTNISDLSGHRPGLRAIQEMDDVKTPYIELGITKDEIREMASHLGISIADKPASACLSSRIPWGNRIEPDDLRMVDKAENTLRDMGLTQVRVRHHGDLARIQCVGDEVALAMEKREEIDSEMRRIGYRYITLDLRYYGE